MSADPKMTKLATVAKYGIAVGAIAVLEPVLVSAFQGTVALIGTIAVGAIAVNLAPYVEMKLKNMKLKLVKHEAATNPIETLQNQWIDMKKALEERAQAVKTFNTETQNFAQKVEEFSAKLPQRAPQYQAQLSKMRYVLRKQLDGLKKGKQKLDEFDIKIQEADAEWQMALAAQAANKAMSKFEQPDAIEFLKQQTALNAVRTAMNDVISDLDNAIALDYTTLGDDVIDVQAKPVAPAAAIENNPSDVLEGLLNTSEQQVPVKR